MDHQPLDDFLPDDAEPQGATGEGISGGLLDPATYPDQAVGGDSQGGQPSNDVDPMLWGLSTTAPGGRQTYIWPVAGGGTPAVRGSIGPNGLRYADGGFSPDGSARNGRPHYGIDLPATKGDAVSAVGDGVVQSHGSAEGWGNYVAIRHPDGYISVYGHLDSDPPLTQGQRVQQGQMVGTVGNSGNAKDQGTHLHLEIRKDVGAASLATVKAGAKVVDPTAWINGALGK